MSTLKARLYQELAQKTAIAQEGVSFDPTVLRHLDLGGAAQENINCLFTYSRDIHPDLDVPPYFILPHGLITQFNVDQKSPNRLEHDGRDFYLTRRDGESIPVAFGGPGVPGAPDAVCAPSSWIDEHGPGQPPARGRAGGARRTDPASAGLGTPDGLPKGWRRPARQGSGPPPGWEEPRPGPHEIS